MDISFFSRHLSAWNCINVVRTNSSLGVKDIKAPILKICRFDEKPKVLQDDFYFKSLSPWTNEFVTLFFLVMDDAHNP